MIATLLRFFLFRFLPRRLVPILTLYELYRVWRRLSRGRSQLIRSTAGYHPVDAPLPADPGGRAVSLGDR